jgi:hypothetical protein
MTTNTRKLRFWAITVVVFTQVGHVHALTVNFDYRYDTNGFFNDQRKQTLQMAGDVFSARLNDALNVVGGISSTFASPGGTGGNVTLSNFTASADTVTVFVGGRSLGGTTLGFGGSVFNSGNRGEGSNDFAPLFGTISFNSNANWYFDTDPRDVEAFNGSDFFSVALHELGHVLGIGLAPTWNNKLVGTSGNFTAFSGTNARTAFGGSNPGVTADGDHWREGLQSRVNGVAQEAAFDPTLTTGRRKYLTEVDWAALQDIGWEVAATPVPLPAAVWLLGSILVAAFRTGLRRRTRA